MAQVNIKADGCKVMNIKKFTTRMGNGADFYVEVKGNAGTVYLQVVLYDAAANYAVNSVHEGDIIDITGILSVKPYQKNDGTAGCSLMVVQPEMFDKHIGGGRIEPIMSYVAAGITYSGTAHAKTANNAETAQAVIAENDYWDDSDLWDAVAEAEKNKKQQPPPIEELPF